MEFQFRYLVLFLLFSEIDGFYWFWMGSLHRKSSQKYPVNAGVPQGSILGHTLFLLHINGLPDMLSVILLSVPMILLSILSVIRHLISDNNLNWLPNLILIYKTLWIGARSGLLISKLGKLNWFCFTGLITLVLLMWK